MANNTMNAAMLKKLQEALWKSWEQQEKANQVVIRTGRALIQNQDVAITTKDLVAYAKTMNELLKDTNKDITELTKKTIRFAQKNMMPTESQDNVVPKEKNSTPY